MPDRANWTRPGIRNEQQQGPTKNEQHPNHALERLNQFYSHYIVIQGSDFVKKKKKKKNANKFLSSHKGSRTQSIKHFEKE